MRAALVTAFCASFALASVRAEVVGRVHTSSGAPDVSVRQRTANAGSSSAVWLRASGGAAPAFPRLLQNRYIVTFTAAASVADMEELEHYIEAHGGQVRNRFRTVLKGFSAFLPPELAAEVEQHEHVEHVEAEQVMSGNKGGFGIGGH